MQDLVERIVMEVIKELSPQAQQGEWGIYNNIETAIAQAKTAERQVAKLSLQELEKIIAGIRKKTMENGKLSTGFWCHSLFEYLVQINICNCR